jgi:predicted DNA-binding protein (MmcQ/YjbR family)
VVAISAPEDIEALVRVREICRRFRGAVEAELQDRPLFRVGRRRFALFNGASSPPRPRWNTSGRSLHFLADPNEVDALRDDPRFTASPHHGDRGWFAVRLDTNEIGWDEIAELLESAYRQVAPRQHPS